MDELRRSELQKLLEDLLGSGNVYFQPPENRHISYPCIVYERDKNSVKRANNKLYHAIQGYQLTYIDHNPDSPTLKKLLELPLCSFERHFETSGLNHDVFVIYY